MGQVVVWEGTVVGKNKKKDFTDWMEENGYKVKYLEEFKTLPEHNADGNIIKGTGGRNDLLFELGEKVDVGKFSIWRLNYGMRWWEDYLDNGAYKYVPSETLKKYPYGWGENPNKYII